MIAISLPYYSSLPYMRQAVESILQQTWGNLLAIVVNDADNRTPPWSALSGIDDDRLVRVNLSHNRGPYFIHGMVLNAVECDYLAVQASDDWSEPERLEILMDGLLGTPNSAAFSALRRWKDGRVHHIRSYAERIRRALTADMNENYVPEVGVLHAPTLRDAGGYYGGFRVGYDSLIMGVLRILGNVHYVDTPLYNVRIREGSLTTSPDTGKESKYREGVKAKLDAIYGEVFRYRARYVRGEISRDAFVAFIREQTKVFLGAESKAELNSCTAQLKDLLHTRSGSPRGIDVLDR